MLTDLDLVNLCVACYEEPAAFDAIIDQDGVWVGVKHYEDCSVIAFRGSTTFLDWVRDFEASMVPDPTLGWVEMGFLRGMRDIKAHVDTIVPYNKPMYITGHSLGAARALLFAALCNAAEEEIAAVVTFGSPRPGGQKLKNILALVPVRSYKNGDDPVTDVPLDIPLIDGYIHPHDLIAVDVPANPGDTWGLLSRHHSQLYQQAMKKLCATS